MKKKTICFDIDGVICKTNKSDYKNSSPLKKNIKIINELYDKKYNVILFTARYMGRFKNNSKKATKLGKKYTLKQLKEWGVNYNKIFFAKPSFDIVVDDKSIFFKKNWTTFFKKFN